MRFFPIHILVKDLSFMIFYFLLMKYNLTNESELGQSLKNHPSIADWSFWSMIVGSLFYNITTILVSLITYFPFVYVLKKLVPKKKTLRIILTGFFLTTTTPIYYLILTQGKHNDYYLPKAEVIAWILCFVLSIVVYYAFNNRNKNVQKSEPVSSL